MPSLGQKPGFPKLSQIIPNSFLGTQSADIIAAQALFCCSVEENNVGF